MDPISSSTAFLTTMLLANALSSSPVTLPKQPVAVRYMVTAYEVDTRCSLGYRVRFNDGTSTCKHEGMLFLGCTYEVNDRGQLIVEHNTCKGLAR